MLNLVTGVFVEGRGGTTKREAPPNLKSGETSLDCDSVEFTPKFQDFRQPMTKDLFLCALDVFCRGFFSKETCDLC